MKMLAAQLYQLGHEICLVPLYMLLDLVCLYADRKDVIIVSIGDNAKAVTLCENERPVAREHDVWRLLHDASRNADRLDDVPDRGYRTRAPAAPIHD